MHTYPPTHILPYQILPDYIDHVHLFPESLLSRFFCLFRLKPKKSYYVVLNNVFVSERNMIEVLYVCMYVCMYVCVCVCKASYYVVLNNVFVSERNMIEV